jgi:hypothetical protein
MSNLKKFWILFIVFIIVDISLTVLLPAKFWANFIFDDGCFYIKTAHNFAAGLGSTFDGVNSTNGYQPLWFITLSGVYFVCLKLFESCSPQFLVKVTIFIHFLLFYLTFYFTYKSFKLLFKTEAVKVNLLLCMALCITPIFVRNIGMEMPLTTLLFSVYLWIKSREFSLSEEHLISKIVILTLISFARIDFFFTFVPILILYESYNKNLRVHLKNLFTIALPVVLVVSLYFVNNYIQFGHLLTISGVVKSTFPLTLHSEGISHIVNFYRFQPISGFNILLLISACAILGVRVYRNHQTDNRKIEVYLFWALLGFTAFTMQNLLFNREILREWYFAGPIFVLAIATTEILRKKKYLTIGISLVFLTIFVLYTYNARIKLHKYDSLYDYSLELKDLVNEEDEIIQIDYSGLIGLFSERKVVNGDGLINSFEFYDHVKNNTVPDYLKKYHIDYYSTYSAFVDTTTNTVNDRWVELGGWKLTFPLEKVKYRKMQHFDSYGFSSESEWFLISLN